MMLGTCVLLFSALLFVSLVYAQTTHTISVGELGNFYDPPNLSAGLDDTVIFSFFGPVHTVTQAAFKAPCIPLPGGFNSGAAGRGENVTSNVAPTWSLKITDVNEPIWYYCGISTPIFHCASGMVGAINPSSEQTLAEFQKAAEAFKGTPSPVGTVALLGSGAFATGSPSVPAGSSAVGSIISTSPPVSTASSISAHSTPTSTRTTSTVSTLRTTNVSKSHLGAIIGGGAIIGVIGGLVGGLLVIGALLWYLRHRRSNGRRDSASTNNSLFRYNLPVRAPSDAFQSARANENLRFNHGAPTQINENPMTQDSSPDLTRPLFPVRRGQFVATPVNPAMSISPLINPHATVNDYAPTNVGAQVSNIDIQTFANEVAQVLIRSLPENTLNAQRPANDDTGTYTRPQSMRVTDPFADGPPTADHSDLPAYRSQSGASSPPAYRRQSGVSSPVPQKANRPRD